MCDMVELAAVERRNDVAFVPFVTFVHPSRNRSLSPYGKITDAKSEEGLRLTATTRLIFESGAKS